MQQHVSTQAVFNVFLKTAGAYDSYILGKPAAASDCGTVNTQCMTPTDLHWRYS